MLSLHRGDRVESKLGRWGLDALIHRVEGGILCDTKLVRSVLVEASFLYVYPIVYFHSLIEGCRVSPVWFLIDTLNRDGL